jgi:P-type E1-E2 ATPase
LVTARTYEIPGVEAFELEYLLLDVNGTLTDRGRLIEGVVERVNRLSGELAVQLLSADTFGTLDELVAELGVEARRISTGDDKEELLRTLGTERCAAIGNGTNDAAMLSAARLGIAVVGPEGASRAALDAADVVCGAIVSALDLLLDPRVVAATLRP